MTPRGIIEVALREGRSKLLEHEAFELIRYYGIPTPRTILVHSAEEASEHADEIGYPIALKIVSPDIIHKSDVGGVRLNLVSREEVRKAVENMLKTVSLRMSNARIAGILMYRMAPPGIEVIVGGIRDAIFDAAIMFGLGGIFVEVLRDVTFRVAPIAFDEALEMIEEIKSSKILTGYRGQQPVNREAIADIIAKTSTLIVENKEIETVDLNPVIAYGDSAIVVDAKVIIKHLNERRSI